MAGIDWRALFIPDTPALEIFIRGTVIYLSLFLMMRLVLKRQAGTVAISDLLLIVLIADAAQNGMAGDYHSLPDGLILVATLIFWNFFLDWLGYRIPLIRKLIHPAPLPLIKKGKILQRNLRKELITREELMSHLREQGIKNPEDVEEALMEGDGQISVVAKSKADSSSGTKKKHAL